MGESFVDRESGWRISRRPFRCPYTGLEFIEETAFDPETGRDYLRQALPDENLDPAAWVRHIRTLENVIRRDGLDPMRRVLLMLDELHRRGYQRLRLAPGLSPSGLDWRGFLAASTDISSKHGATFPDWDRPHAFHGSGMGGRYFQWTDAARDSPAQLADKFVARFPELSELGLGPDPEYATWYVKLLRCTAPADLPYAYADCPVPEGVLGLWGGGVMSLPPPGRGPVKVTRRWLTRNVIAVAQTVHAERRFDGLPVLADALEEAGCSDGYILDHCRAAGHNDQQCWVVNTLLREA